MKASEFEFPTTRISTTVPSDVVFCGTVMTRRTDESDTRVLLRSESSGRVNRFVAWLRSPSGRESLCRRSESFRRRRHYNGMFGTVKFPLQMELSDIKMRQDRRELSAETAATPIAPVKDGRESCWELARPLRRRGTLKNALFGCIPIV